MSKTDLTHHLLGQIKQSAETILQRFRPVQTVEDLTNSPSGMEKFDSICMLLITIGEGLKNLDKATDGLLLALIPSNRLEKSKRTPGYYYPSIL